jgi:hypothetical protein
MTLRLVAAGLALLVSCKGSPPAPASNATTGPAPAPVGSSVQPPAQSGSSGSAAPVPGSVDTAAGSGSAVKPAIHGEKWQNADEGGVNFLAFRETWVYVDGAPRGALIFAELPAALPPAWKDDVEGLDFHPGDPGPHEKKIQLLRWRLSDYLRLIGVDLARIKMVYLHGNGYVAIPGDRFRRYARGITFDLTGNDLSTSRFYWPTDMPTNTAYDRYAAVSVFIDKPPLTLDEHNNPFIDGVEVMGIPYHGTPERGGFRVYVDNKLAMVVKRNELGATGRISNERWDLNKLLAARGVKAQPVAGDLVMARDMNLQRRDRLDAAYVQNLEIGVNAQASGTMLVGKDDRPATALHLYTKGHVPPVVVLPVFERDVPTPKRPQN